MNSHDEVARLWTNWLAKFPQRNLQQRLMKCWPDDPNLGRISFAYPPTFQPGYVGKNYGRGRRILFVGYNPGEGRTASDADAKLAKAICRLADGKLSFQEYNQHLFTQIESWVIYRGVGVFREHGPSTMARAPHGLLPEAARPSLDTVALVNAFPFKTVGNSRPLCAGALASLFWQEFTVPMISALKPDAIVYFTGLPKSRQRALHSLCGNAFRVWHPSYNSRTRPERLASEWQPFAEFLSSGSN